MVLLLALVGVLILGLIVFGGGQVFMPLFKSLWHMLDNYHHIDNLNQKISDIFTIANSTPGVVSTKFAAITGLLVANGQWWGWLAMILTFLIFAIPSIIMIWWANKMVQKSEKSKYLSAMTKYLKPVIAGVVLALAIQLFIGTAFPFLVFNGDVYVGKDSSNIFHNWRLIVLIIYSVVVTIESAYLYYKNKVSLFLLILIHIVIGLIIFEPWLM